ncbi:hypothetical protein MAR_007990 [Mya arenaria]|uniref:Uncharacterized protein n=1 Tax=Mya arenaria TaxID=6604 RepID=A0ABY7DUM6_MYAAR|nr:hypothetical protein MAR_007990 [Mya arenaria]
MRSEVYMDVVYVSGSECPHTFDVVEDLLNFAMNFFLYVASSSATRFRANLRKVLRLKQKEDESMFTRAPPKTNSVMPLEESDMKSGPSEEKLDD